MNRRIRPEELPIVAAHGKAVTLRGVELERSEYRNQNVCTFLLTPRQAYAVAISLKSGTRWDRCSIQVSREDASFILCFADTIIETYIATGFRTIWND